MVTDKDYDIRPWGERFWRWDCRLCSPRTSRGYAVVGPPLTREDAAAAAERHVREEHEYR